MGLFALAQYLYRSVETLVVAIAHNMTDLLLMDANDMIVFVISGNANSHAAWDLRYGWFVFFVKFELSS